MLIVKIRTRRGLSITTSWFCDDEKLLRTRRLFSIHKQTGIVANISGLKRVPFLTKHIDLRQELPMILKSFDKNTVYEVKRAEKEGATCEVMKDISLFVKFFNDFALARKIRTTSESEIAAYGENLLITACKQGGEFMAMHSYVVDRQTRKARLQYSGSSYIGENSKERRAVIGRANRYLHFKDIEYFKQQGFEVYDLGGYAFNPTDKAMIGINSFKDSFGGSLVENEFDYYPVWLYWVSKVRSLLRK